MMISSEKANMRAAKAVDFAKRHSWAKYPCLAAVSVIYSAEYVRIKIRELGEKLRESAAAPFRPLGGRIAAFILSGAFAFMAVPLSGFTAYADEPAEAAADEARPANAPVLVSKITPSESQTHRDIASTPEEIADKITFEGLAKQSSDYNLTLNIKSLTKDVTARFTASPRLLPQVLNSFAYYQIPTDDLYISPVDVTIYCTKERYKLNLSEGYSADITLPIPEEMYGHFDDLKIVRLEDNGTMTIIDGVIADGNDGKTITFNTDHFSVFALVSYNTGITAENISSGAGVTAAGVHGDISMSFGNSVFDEDRRRFRKAAKRKIYRIKRIVNERDLLL